MSLTYSKICARRDQEGPCVWTLTGLAIRLATKLGLHRDGSAFNLPPFEVELRRRLWWQICILDVRTAEDNGSDPCIFQQSFNTNFPLNVDDSNLNSGMSATPTEAVGRTDMLFSLQRFEISYAIRKLVFSDKFTRDNGYVVMSTAQKIAFIEDLHEKMQAKYLHHCDMKIPLDFVTATAERLIVAKLKLVVHHTARKNCESGVTDTDIAFLTTSIEIIECAHNLRTNQAYQRWVWLFQTYVEWDALAYLLLHLASTRTGVNLDRAWDAVNTAFSDWKDETTSSSGEQERRWRRMEELRVRAIAVHGGRSASALASKIKDNAQNHLVLYPAHSEHHGNLPAESENSATNSSYRDGARNPVDTFTTRSTNANQGPNPGGASFMTDSSDWQLSMLATELDEGFSWDMHIDHGVSGWL